MKKNIIAVKEYCIKVLNGMALGLFSSLIIGLICKQIGTLCHIDLLVVFGQIAQYMMGPAIGVGVAYSLRASPLGIFASLITGAIGAQTIICHNGIFTLSIGEPVGAFVAALAGVECAKRIFRKTQFDIILVPAITIISGGIVGHFFAPVIASFMSFLGTCINITTELHPFFMGMAIAVGMGIILTLPISSAALAIALGLDGLAAGAATVGCACQMIGFAVMGYRKNRLPGFFAQGLGTSMLQIPNIIKNPKIWIPPILTSAILGPFSTMLFHMQSNKIGAGMGTSGLVGQFASFEVMGRSAFFGVLLLHFLLPAFLCGIISWYMKKKSFFIDNDLLLPENI